MKINFIERKLNRRLYTTVEILFITKRVKLVEKNEFIATAFDTDNKTFIIYIASLASSNLNIHPSYKAQVILLI